MADDDRSSEETIDVATLWRNEDWLSWIGLKASGWMGAKSLSGCINGGKNEFLLLTLFDLGHFYIQGHVYERDELYFY